MKPLLQLLPPGQQASQSAHVAWPGLAALQELAERVRRDEMCPMHQQQLQRAGEGMRGPQQKAAQRQAHR